MSDSIQARLQERIKELTALHRTAGLLQDIERPLEEVMPLVSALIPPAWQYPEITEGRIRCGELIWATPGFQETPWRQRGKFRLRDGETGEIEVVYLEKRPTADDGPFLSEEFELIRSLAEMLRAFFQHRRDDAAILASNERLEGQVAERTASLRRLAAEVSLAEERERRRIAEDLHDHLGQGLALIKLRLKALRGDAALGGHDLALDELVDLSDQAIRYTRGLTMELSPPMLYELGLGPALEWLGEKIARKHGLRVRVRASGRLALPDDLKVMLWKSARELLHNVVKHAEATNVKIRLEATDRRVLLEVADDGRGFDSKRARHDAGDGFGLFSIDERLFQLGGRMELDSAPDRGTRVRLIVNEPQGEV